jgi:hypothetical protein
MKKVIDLEQIEAREKELLDELGSLRRIKKYAVKYGADLSTPLPPRRDPELPSGTVPSIALTEMLRQIIESFNGAQFNFPEIEAQMSAFNQVFSRSAIFDGISNLKEMGHIVVVEKGAGRRPAEYRVTESFTPPVKSAEEH